MYIDLILIPLKQSVR